jgi:hypothetical protein
MHSSRAETPRASASDEAAGQRLHHEHRNLDRNAVSSVRVRRSDELEEGEEEGRTSSATAPTSLHTSRRRLATAMPNEPRTHRNTDEAGRCHPRRR